MNPTQRAKPKRRSRAEPTASRRPVTRREYAELLVRLGSVELQVRRNRADLELQARRIAQLEGQIAAPNAAAPAVTRPVEIAALVVPPAPPVES
jgi:hypothetical protein